MAAGPGGAGAAAAGRGRSPRPALSLCLQFADARHRGVLSRARVGRWIRAALAAPAEMTVRVVDAEEGAALNAAWRGKPGPTNVLTFAYGSEPVLHADVVLCAPVVDAEAREHGRTLEAHYAHLLVHAALHAQGFDHQAEAEATRMEAREAAILAGLGFADPYAG